MAGEVELSALLDFFADTTAKYPKDKYRNLLVNQSYIFQEFMRSQSPKSMSGTKCTFNAMIMGDADDTGDAADGGPGRYGSYETMGSEATEYQTTGEIPWSYYETYWILSSQELRLNAGEEGFINLQKSKVEGTMTRLANILERDFWSRTSWQYESTAKPMILGPEYWITDDGYHINDSGGTAGTAVGGIDPTDSDFNDFNSRNRWRNQYSQITVANELIDALDDMFVDCKFVAPPKVDMNDNPLFKKFKIVMDKTSFKLYKRLQKRLRDNVGNDLASGRPTFNNVELQMADRMAARTDSTYQTFFLNTDTWECYIDDQNEFRREKPVTPPNQDARLQRIYYWPAVACKDRRMNGKVWGYPAAPTEG